MNLTLQLALQNLSISLSFSFSSLFPGEFSTWKHLKYMKRGECVTTCSKEPCLNQTWDTAQISVAWVIHKLTHLHEKYINTKDLWFRSLCYFHNLHEKVGVEKGESIQKHYNTQDSSWNKQLGVPAQPQVVKSHLLSKVAPVEQRRNTGADMDFKF